MNWESVNIAFQQPFSLIVSGVSFSGKTTAVTHLLLNRYKYIQHLEPETPVVYFYKHYDSKMFAQLTTDKAVSLVQKCPSNAYINEWFAETEATGALFVIDDLMTELYKDTFLQECFTTLRHRNASK